MRTKSKGLFHKKQGPPHLQFFNRKRNRPYGISETSVSNGFPLQSPRF